MDLVSIIIPTYNREKLIDETIESVLNQSYSAIEVLVIDDGSSDGTVKKVEEISKKDKRVRLLYRENEKKGAASCRNIGIKNSTGKYIMFLDSDDMLVSKAVECRVQNIGAKDFIVSQSKLFFNRKNDLGKYYNKLSKNIDPVVRFLREDYPWNISSFLVRRDYLLSNNILFEESINVHHDVFISILLLVKGGNYITLNEVHSYIRVGNKDKMTRDLTHCSTISGRIKFYMYMHEKLPKYREEIEYGFISVLYDAILYKCFRLLVGKNYILKLGIKRSLKLVFNSYILFLQRYRRNYTAIENVLNKLRLISKLEKDEKKFLPDKSTMGFEK